MSVVSNDFAGALRELRLIVMSLQSENQQLKNEMSNMQKQISKINQDAVGVQNTAVLSAAASGNQVQLESLQHQPLTVKQAEIVRLSLNQQPEAPVSVSIDPQLLEAFIASKPNQSLPERHREVIDSGSQAANNRMHTIAQQLEANALEMSQRRQQHQQYQDHTNRSRYTKRTGSNLLASINPSFTYDDY